MTNNDQNPKNKLKISSKQTKKFVAVGILAALAISIGLVMITPGPTVYKIPASSIPHDSMGMMHIHPHLSVIIDGKPATIPANIGIDSHLWNVHTLDSYGMTGMAPLHTHKDDGMIHVESYKDQDYTLGQFLDIWGIPLDNYNVKVTVDGNPVSDYRNHAFQDGERIVMNLTTK
ncbi:MAG TPA: hypothetical protein VFA69_06325 [Candidatus Nitrosotalea sp.]|nr:hypothetical protein [Candidatus Nitrosotalea sp.]